MPVKRALRNFATTAFAPAALTLVACASTAESTIATKTGCDPKKIHILEHEPDPFHFNEERWVATCEGRKFYCNSPPGQGQQGMRCLQAFRHPSDSATKTE